jgi:hypothetical protein
VRRRWPRAYDGGEDGVNPRYRRAYDRDQRVERRRSSRSPLSLEAMRQSPLRNGLIGLAVAGTAAPLAINRYQQALRTDPSHEQRLTRASGEAAATDSAVSDAWRALEGEQAAADRVREETIQAKIEQYADYDLTREMAESIYARMSPSASCERRAPSATPPRATWGPSGSRS